MDTVDRQFQYNKSRPEASYIANLMFRSINTYNSNVFGQQINRMEKKRKTSPITLFHTEKKSKSQKSNTDAGDGKLQILSGRNMKIK